ncbi:hypothetical protein K0M31_010830 [Melipona bicolor]|uniref:Uncharacterized protein n=1 Tax=Melipona bicolor TaxID=60889 RepID=A0AA40KHZ6_9HYME|nr:hypothetical protein K0M31_010830 [Melipona bicolor]
MDQQASEGFEARLLRLNALSRQSLYRGHCLEDSKVSTDKQAREGMTHRGECTRHNGMQISDRWNNKSITRHVDDKPTW